MVELVIHYPLWHHPPLPSLRLNTVSKSSQNRFQNCLKIVSESSQNRLIIQYNDICIFWSGWHLNVLTTPMKYKLLSRFLSYTKHPHSSIHYHHYHHYYHYTYPLFLDLSITSPSRASTYWMDDLTMTSLYTPRTILCELDIPSLAARRSSK